MLKIIYRKTFTDYIDDVSTTYIDPALFDKYYGVGSQRSINATVLSNRQIGNKAQINSERGNKKNNDAYFTANLKISIVI